MQGYIFGIKGFNHCSGGLVHKFLCQTKTSMRSFNCQRCDVSMWIILKFFLHFGYGKKLLKKIVGNRIIFLITYFLNTNLKHSQQFLPCDLQQQNSIEAMISHDTCSISFDNFLANKANCNVAYSWDHLSIKILKKKLIILDEETLLK